LPAASARAHHHWASCKNRDFQPWKDAGLSFGLQAIVAIPLVAGPDLIGALAVCRRSPILGPVEVQVFEELTRNVQFGIQSRRTRVAYQQSCRSRPARPSCWKMPWKMRWLPLPRSGATRPYTAGHQKRAQLAVLIGQELRLPHTGCAACI
jgi:hypothetical protein